ncbi:TRAP transporter large permease [Devosia nitrariae]|uniref:TRAP transporter large permease protein n=1 Tax=Devosia nitrariae TaxID=2071872 RepID=A0ABQ5W3Z5_9HYPH|nr:TRAP transporter large permease subunit [Devosia nitrariae]GLQ54778.1 C4-dicarboxylate ABC transporter [Devosia nitrariae]
MLIVAATFVVLLLAGMPVAFAIGISGALFFLQHPELPYTIPVQVTVSQTQNFALLAVPLFIIAGNLLNKSGITEALLNLASVLTGRLKGGLAQVTIAMSALMGGVSGSAIADAAMQARILGDGMAKRGLSRGFSAAAIAFSAVLTPMIPPGIGFILYGTIGQVSIGRMFAAGILPAVVLYVALTATVLFMAHIRGYAPERETRPSLGEIALAFRGGIWALLFPVMLLFGLRMGVFTPSEIGAFAVVYAVFIGTLVYRQMRPASFAEAMQGSLADVGAVMFLIALSAIFTYGIVFERVPELISGSILGLTDNLSAVMVIVALLVLVMGLFIDATVLIIMLTPIFLPLIRQLDGDPVHFGLVFILAATIGNFTPPVGAAMYAVCSIMKVSVAHYTREALPFFLTVTAVTIALVFLPDVVLAIPRLIFG